MNTLNCHGKVIYNFWTVVVLWLDCGHHSLSNDYEHMLSKAKANGRIRIR